MALSIHTEINIKASRELIWGILTDFEKYSEWNPFIKSLTGVPQVGGKIKVEFAEMSFQPKVMEYSNNERFEWLGQLGFKGVFDGRHSFELKENADGSTTLIHGEQFNGIMVPFFKKKLLTDTLKDFEAMNVALKDRAEGLV